MMTCQLHTACPINLTCFIVKLIFGLMSIQSENPVDSTWSLVKLKLLVTSDQHENLDKWTWSTLKLTVFTCRIYTTLCQINLSNHVEMNQQWFTFKLKTQNTFQSNVLKYVII